MRFLGSLARRAVELEWPNSLKPISKPCPIFAAVCMLGLNIPRQSQNQWMLGWLPQSSARSNLHWALVTSSCSLSLSLSLSHTHTHTHARTERERERESPPSAEDGDISKVLSAFKAWSWWEYTFACFSYCEQSCCSNICLLWSFKSIYLILFKYKVLSVGKLMWIDFLLSSK